MNNEELIYPQWKLIAWRYVRVFMATFLGIFSIDQLIVGGQPIDQTLLKSAVAAGIAAIVKIIRDEVSRGDESHPIDKLPL